MPRCPCLLVCGVNNQALGYDAVTKEGLALAFGQGSRPDLRAPLAPLAPAS